MSTTRAVARPRRGPSPSVPAIVSGRRAAVAAGVALALLLAGCSDEPVPPRSPDPVGSAPPPVPSVFYLDPANPAEAEAQRRAARGDSTAAEALRSIGSRPSAKWLTGDAARDEVDAFLGQAAIAGQTPVLVVHNVPQRDCGRQGEGGARTGAEYQAWIRDVAAGVAGRPVIVVLEPGALPDAVAGCVRDAAGRLALLRDAVTVLASTGRARIYLDAGHPGWIRDVEALAAALRQAGVDQADGFALNVANFVRTTDNVTYGHRISDALGGDTTFVVDTSRNGNGPYPAERVGGAPSWCNPPGRAIGEEPTADPGLPRVDALLWIKFPGESDGDCRPGEPPAGQFWPTYAISLIAP
ncbi:MULTISPECIES: glycoside hydrolase family 6 protein [unclassified Micromonospora]|uniref:glycoside hydrolase family 6 protein n=1 Tax=unclassified Micromonospora TaxID=2617518 RepID=UPI0022B7534A|nr:MULTISPECIES: glycoside hydrolase family 6 protein [unclassified Micromonospora]MCZ7418882.1 glycoside hydrolase family 6 protein [Verrucosispora sp. WMMA2121]WBB92569.1 glycoside hydrolase family 6 protein [Verrucosispora sp. WMMC514]